VGPQGRQFECRREKRRQRQEADRCHPAPHSSTMAGMVASRVVLLAAAWCVAANAQKPGEWVSLFDGKSLQGWKETPFIGRGTVKVENGAMILGAGDPMTGVNYAGTFPKSNYEVRLEAARIKGSDFFASLTFPAGNSFCTWVTGGWGGDIVGLSNLDGWDASENDTTQYFNFETGHWYVLRLQVTPERIKAWIDEKPIIDADIKGRTIELRFGEIELSKPLGFASYGTTGGLRKIEYRVLAARKQQ
jgi:hypothetical protein